MGGGDVWTILVGCGGVLYYYRANSFNIEVKGVLFLLHSLYSLMVFLFSIDVSLILSIESCMDGSGHDSLVCV
jgi:hypothetical protein